MVNIVEYIIKLLVELKDLRDGCVQYVINIHLENRCTQ